MKFHIGCGLIGFEGYVNSDLYRTGATDLVFDVQEPWPVKDDSLSVVASSHVLEHLDRPKDFFRHAWNALQDNGMLSMRMPDGNSDASYADLTHIRRWHPASFCFLQPGYGVETKNPQHVWDKFYSIDVVELKAQPYFWFLTKWPLKYLKAFDFCVKHLMNSVTEMYVFLRALKSEYTIRQWVGYGKKANAVPIMYVKEWVRDKQLNIVN